MSLLKTFKRRKYDDLFNVSNFLLKEANTNFTKQKLAENIREHREYPSLLSLKESLSVYGIESEAIRRGKYSLGDFETPFISSIQKEGWPKANFTVVTKVEADRIEFLDPVSNKKNTTSIGLFEKLDKDVILLLDTSTTKDEDNFVENKKKQRNSLLAQQIPLFLIALALIFTISSVLLQQPFSWTSIYGLAYLLTTVMPCLAPLLLPFLV